jgi:hypothetical protein
MIRTTTLALLQHVIVGCCCCAMITAAVAAQQRHELSAKRGCMTVRPSRLDGTLPCGLQAKLMQRQGLHLLGGAASLRCHHAGADDIMTCHSFSAIACAAGTVLAVI